jgi:ferritin-like metal-binding protein YciE
MTALRSPEDVLSLELKQIVSAERLLTRALPRMAKKVQSERLKELLDQRIQQGEELIEQIENVLEELEAPKARAKNVAAEGLIDDANQHLEDIDNERLSDPLLLASVQKIEHYCIAAWGTVRAMGQLMEQGSVVKAMEHALDEGKKLNQEMTKLAEEEINPQMLEASSQEEGEEGEEEDEEEGESGSSSQRGKSSSSKIRSRAR